MELPKALEKQKQRELLKKLPNWEARQCLIKGNLRLVKKFSQSYARSTGKDEQDLFQVGAIGLIKAIDKYKVDNNVTLSTYASRGIENEMLAYLKEERKYSKELSFDRIAYSDEEGYDVAFDEISPCLSIPDFVKSIEDRNEFVRVINIISNRLYKKSISHFMALLYMISGKTQADTGKLLNMSQRNAGKWFAKIRSECLSISTNNNYNTEDSDVFFYLKDDIICLKIKGYPLIKKLLDPESFREIADELKMMC